MQVTLIGPPGGGKGTQAERLSNKYKIPHVSTGEMLRAIIKQNTSLSKKVKLYINNGNLMPDNVIITLIKKRIQKNDCINGFILDGFPRTIIQAKYLENLLNKLKIKLNWVFHIKVSDSELLKRLLKRSNFEHRIDDNIEIIKKRLKVYNEYIGPIIDFYKNQNKLVEIDGLGKVSEITNRIFMTIKTNTT